MQRDVAQLGSAPLWGSGGLGFKSQHSDSYKKSGWSLRRKIQVAALRAATCILRDRPDK